MKNNNEKQEITLTQVPTTSSHSLTGDNFIIKWTKILKRVTNVMKQDLLHCIANLNKKVIIELLMWRNGKGKNKCETKLRVHYYNPI